jgi:VWFA-related protein
MILVTATDHSGAPKTQLSEKDLAITDNEQPAEVISARSASQFPLRVAFVLLAGKKSFGQQQNAAADLAHKILRANVDRAFVISARGDKPWASSRLEWQADADSLEKEIRGLDKDTGFNDPFSFDMTTEDAGVSRHFTLLQYGTEGSSAFSVLWAMMRSDPSPARHAVVIFRDPWAHSPGFGGTYTEMVENDHVRLISDAQQQWTSFYVITTEDPKPVSKDLSEIYAPIQTGEGGYNRVYDQNMERTREHALAGGKVNLERIATETGGGIWWNSKKNFSDAVSAIANDLNSQFAVTYAVHSEPGSGPKHLLAVKSLNSDVRISAPKAYFSHQAPPETKPAATPELQPRPAAPNQNQ